MSSNYPLIGVMVAALGLVGCGPAQDEQAPANVSSTAVSPVRKIADAIPLPEPPLDRKKLLLAAADAASAFAAGVDDKQAQAALAGRRFALSLRFGCSGPADDPDAASMTWSYDADKTALTVRAKPDLSGETPVARPMLAADVEAVEGFWVPRPWLYQDACAKPAADNPAPLPPPTVGLAQLFTASDSRTERRVGRAYQAVLRVKPEDLPRAQGFNLVLSGRLAPFSDGRIIRCAAADGQTRPICIISVQFGRVAIENAESRAVLAEWGTG